MKFFVFSFCFYFCFYFCSCQQSNNKNINEPVSHSAAISENNEETLSLVDNNSLRLMKSGDVDWSSFDPKTKDPLPSRACQFLVEVPSDVRELHPELKATSVFIAPKNCAISNPLALTGFTTLFTKETKVLLRYKTPLKDYSYTPPHGYQRDLNGTKVDSPSGSSVKTISTSEASTEVTPVLTEESKQILENLKSQWPKEQAAYFEQALVLSTRIEADELLAVNTIITESDIAYKDELRSLKIVTNSKTKTPVLEGRFTYRGIDENKNLTGNYKLFIKRSWIESGELKHVSVLLEYKKFSVEVDGSPVPRSSSSKDFFLKNPKGLTTVTLTSALSLSLSIYFGLKAQDSKTSTSDLPILATSAVEEINLPSKEAFVINELGVVLGSLLLANGTISTQQIALDIGDGSEAF